MERSNEPQFGIRRSWIMAVLLIVPAVAAFGAWDIFINEGQLKPYLRFDSLFLPLYLLIFELPHVIASFFGFFQKEYARHYKRHLFFGLPLLITLGITIFSRPLFREGQASSEAPIGVTDVC